MQKRKSRTAAFAAWAAVAGKQMHMRAVFKQ
jgi:hypothetical protein